MPKVAIDAISKDLLEQIYAEVEARVERKLRAEINDLKRQVKKHKEEAQAWKTKYYAEQRRAQKLEDELSLARAEIRELKQVVEKQNLEIAGLKKRLYGKSSEIQKTPEQVEPAPPKRARGKQPGAKGAGRKPRLELNAQECIHDFSESERICPECGSPFEDVGSRTSQEIHLTTKVVRIIHRRKTVRRTCKCAAAPKIKTAPAPPKLFRGSLFSLEFWQYIILDKYYLQRPINRARSFLLTHGLSVSQGTITNGLKRLHDRQVFKPLIQEITNRVRASKQLQMDETSWKVFQEIEGKKGFLHWLWVWLAPDCCLFQIDKSRSREVASRNIGDDPLVLTSDMLKVYANLGDNVTNSWCWAHVRRYILKLQSIPSLKRSAKQWVERVDLLYHHNNQRLAAGSDTEFEKHDQLLRSAVAEFERLAKSYSNRAKHPEAKSVFAMISNHWDGLSLFVDLPAIPMDNNASERALRSAVVGRKNYYGSGSCWSGELASDLFTIFATLEMNGINPRTWLLEYLNAVAANDCSAPPDAASFLPWNSPPLESLHS